MIQHSLEAFCMRLSEGPNISTPAKSHQPLSRNLRVLAETIPKWFFVLCISSLRNHAVKSLNHPWQFVENSRVRLRWLLLKTVCAYLTLGCSEILTSLGRRGMRWRIGRTRRVGHSGDFGNGAKFVWKMSKSVMQLISIRFWNVF